jgi:hypothetical protein
MLFRTFAVYIQLSSMKFFAAVVFCCVPSLGVCAEPYGPLTVPEYRFCEIFMNGVHRQITDCVVGDAALLRVPKYAEQLMQRVVRLRASQNAEEVSTELQARPFRQKTNGEIPVNRKMVPSQWYEWQFNPQLLDNAQSLEPISVMIYYVDGLAESVHVTQSRSWIIRVRLSCIWACNRLHQ